MNNNRNNRRRGRNTNRNQGGGNSANRIDSRARGNAPQLLDKYKKLAQDAQHNGDRVQAEYYLQFADHYFRVIADNKARQDEARAKRGDERGGSSDDEDGDEDTDRQANRHPRARRDRDSDQDQQDTRQRRSRRNGHDEASGEGDNPFTRDTEDGTDKAPRKRPAARKVRRDAEGPHGSDDEIDIAALPPAIGSDEERPAPRRRRRKADENEDVSALG